MFNKVLTISEFLSSLNGSKSASDPAVEQEDDEDPFEFKFTTEQKRELKIWESSDTVH